MTGPRLPLAAATGGSEPRVSRHGPFAHPPVRAPHRLRLADIRPQVRIVHRLVAPFRNVERMIVDHELVLVLKGAGEVVAGTRRIPFAAHHLFCIPPFVPHAFSSRATCEHIAIHFDLAAGVPASARQPIDRTPYQVLLPHGLVLPFHRVLSPGDGLEALLVDILRQWLIGTEVARLGVQASLQRAIAGLLCSGTEDAAGGSAGAVAHLRVQRAIEHMRARLAEPLTLGDLARAAGLRPSRFAQLFREWTGYSPMDHLRRLRVERARELLADIDLPIRAVAERAGFGDAYQFSKAFRRIDGVSPSQFREAAVAGRRN